MIPILTFRARGRPITPPGADEHAPIVRVNLDTLVTSKLLAQTNSGGGKSYILRGLLEETAGRLPAIVIDPEGEFHTLREKYPFLLAAKHGGDVVADPRTAKRLTRKVMELGASIVIDLYDLEPHLRREWVAIWAAEMTNLPRSLWRPTMIVVDEAHTFAPERGHGEAVSLEPLISLTSLARKRGFCIAFATQRISKFHKDVAAELNNKLIGRTGLDVDVKRAGEELGMDKENRGKLRAMDPGTWYCYGPAFPFGGVELLQGPGVETTHPKPGAVGVAATPAPAKVKAAIAELGDLPKEAAEEARTIDDLRRALQAERTEHARLVKAFQKGVPAPVRQPDPEQQRAQLQLQITAAIDKARKQWNRDSETLARAFVRVLDKAAIDVAKVGAELARHGPNLVEFAAQIRKETAKFAEQRAAVVQNPVQDLVQSSVPKSDHRERVRAAAAKVSSENREALDRLARVDRAVPREPTPSGDGTLSRGALALLGAVAQLEAIHVDEPTREVVAVVADRSPSSSSTDNAFGELGKGGYIASVNGRVRLTDAGRAAAPPAEAPATLEAYHETWRRILGAGERAFFDTALEELSDGTTLSRAELAQRAGRATTSSTTDNAYAKLLGLGILENAGPGLVKAGPLLNPDGLR